MATSGMTQLPSQFPEQEIVMVAERAVRQLIDDLRGELGVKFQQIEESINANKSEAEEGLSDLSAAMTDAFKQNNASLRNEMRALNGDTTQNLTQRIENLQENFNKNLASELSGKESKLNKQIEELERNINASLENIKESGMGVTGSKHR